MTEQEAREKAEAIAAYMQCYRDLTSGEPDGWCAWHPIHGWDVLTFDESKKECDKLALEDFATSERWNTYPVKLVKVRND